MKSSEDRVALVTGSAQGIGKAIAFRLAGDGCTVILTDINDATLEETVTAFREKGFKAHGIAADVSSSKDVKALFEETIRRESRVDFLVNNAGISHKKNGEKLPLLEITEEQWDQVLSVNLKGAFLCSQMAARHMVERQYGRIVNISSMAGKIGNSGVAAAHYCASKAGLICLTKSLALELAPYGVRCNAVAPGIIESEMMKRSSASVNQAFLEKIPMSRFGTADEVAQIVCFLLSDASSYVTGATLDITGGIYMS